MKKNICGLLWQYGSDLKIWVPAHKKVQEVTSVIFDKTFSHKSNEELLDSIIDNSTLESYTEVAGTDTNCDSDESESIPFKKLPPIFNLTSPLSSALSSPLWLRSPIFLQFSQSAQIQLDF